ncbi:MAG: hypothetical protein K1X72_28420 [Pyrinomonadaceae bacterium]|nr:hypothetical protein [Pyrinomonadaceae bacterium]
MNLLEELVQDLKKDNLLDGNDYLHFNIKRDSGLSQFSNPYTTGYLEKGTVISSHSAPEIILEKEPRYSVSAIQIDNNMPQTIRRIRIIKKNSKFSRICTCCQADVFILDAFCPNCNERLIGNFLYYSFFIVSALMIGFMVFFMATSNPY